MAQQNGSGGAGAAAQEASERSNSGHKGVDALRELFRKLHLKKHPRDHAGHKKPGLGRLSTNPLQMAAHEALQTTRKALHLENHLSQNKREGTATKGTGAEQSRTVCLHRGDANSGFCDNSIRTTKYNPVTFMPIFLYEMFSRGAYFYFLVQACLAWWNVVSPFGGLGSTMALVFVLVVAAVKAIWEDMKRLQEDIRTNRRSKAHLVDDSGSTCDISWRDVRVGQILRVEDGELFPADMICLYSELPDDVCFIKTTNLDGENNLKIRRPVDLRDVVKAEDDVTGVEAKLTCELPNADLHAFKGRFQLRSNGRLDTAVPVTINEMLLRGCMLQNSGHVLGVVVYTGRETRIQMNSAKTPSKLGSYDHFLNFQIYLIILLQIVLCVFCSVAAYIWRERTGLDRAYLGLSAYVEGNYENGLAYTLILFITFWILYSYLVPISLFVSLEIVKFWQGFLYINWDGAMRDPDSGEYARARNTNLNEDLGKIDYVFSDKTGTLTANEMQLREVAIAGAGYGSADFRLEEHTDLRGLSCLQAWEPRLAQGAEALQDDGTWSKLVAGSIHSSLHANPRVNGDHQGEHSLASNAVDSYHPPQGAEARSAHHTNAASEPASTSGRGMKGGGRSRQLSQAEARQLGSSALRLWTNICLCHSLIVEDAPDGIKKVFQGPSPDEVALVDGAQQLGFELLRRKSEALVLRMLGVEATYEILNVMEFSSARGRMSVIARAPDGAIRLYCKGSDAVILGLLRKDTSQDLLTDTHRSLHLFATQGLRTLCLGERTLGKEEYAEWDSRYQQSAGQIDGRDEAMAEAAEEVEKDLELIGCTAIEDKLQQGVASAIQTLLDAGIKVWVITGDKQETAINIAVSCRLIHDPSRLLICNAGSLEEAESRLKELESQLEAAYAPVGGSGDSLPNQDGAQLTRVRAGELVIDGGTLKHILGTPLENLLSSVGARCASVVICRSSPSQKAAVVRMMGEYEMQQAERGAKGVVRWYRRTMRRQRGRMLAIGDGANDVAMIQAADVGVGIMGKEGRQAVNNADYAIAQFRFLTRLLLVHGSLSAYRLSRLIKYSFYKNVSFGMVLFFYQFYCGFSGQALVDDISAAAYNVVFTSVPILLFAVMDRPVKILTTLMRFPQTYGARSSLTTSTFWKNGVLDATIDAAICFFVPYYAIRTSGLHATSDVYSLGKTVFIALLGSVSLEVALVSRYLTRWFIIFVVLSWVLVFPFQLLFPLVQQQVGSPDVAQYGEAQYLFSGGIFWFSALLCALGTFSHRLVERSYVWLFRPQDWAILLELEIREGHDPELGWQAKQRLESLHSLPLGNDIPAPRHAAHAGNQQDHFKHSVDGVAANGMP